MYTSRHCFAKDLWHPEKYNASFNKCKLRSLKLKTPYLGPDLPSMFLKLIIFPLLLLQEQSSNFVHTSRLDTLTARKDSSKKTIDPSAMFCPQNRERTGEKFLGCEVMYLRSCKNVSTTALKRRIGNRESGIRKRKRNHGNGNRNGHGIRNQISTIEN